MEETLERLRKCLTYSEIKAIKVVMEAIHFESGFLISSKVAEQAKITKSVVVNALCKLELVGFIDSRSLGMKGSYIRIIEKELLQNLIKEMM